MVSVMALVLGDPPEFLIEPDIAIECLAGRPLLAERLGDLHQLGRASDSFPGIRKTARRTGSTPSKVARESDASWKRLGFVWPILSEVRHLIERGCQPGFTRSRVFFAGRFHEPQTAD